MDKLCICTNILQGDFKMRKEKKKHSKEIQLPNEEMQKLLANSYYEKSLNQLYNSNVTINHLENIFTNETYY